MKIKDYAIEVGNGYFEQDVGDTELDMMVALCYDIHDPLEDNYYKFLDMLARNVEVVSVSDFCTCCDFSGWAKKYNDKIVKTMRDHNGNFEFDEDEGYLNFVSDLEALIAGYANESTYKMWLDCFK